MDYGGNIVTTIDIYLSQSSQSNYQSSEGKKKLEKMTEEEI